MSKRRTSCSSFALSTHTGVGLGSSLPHLWWRETRLERKPVLQIICCHTEQRERNQLSTNLISLPSACRGDRSGMGGGGAADRPPTPPGRSRWGGGGGTPPETPPPLVGGGGGGIRGIVAVGTLCLNNKKIPNRQMFGAIIKICVC